MENSKDFLLQERKVLEDTLLKIAIKIRDKIKKSNHIYLLTQKSNADRLYGYIYDVYYSMDLLEREIKGFRVQKDTLWICMDLSSIEYDEYALAETYENVDDDVWYPLLKADNTLVTTDSFNVYLTLLGLSECIYQYFE